MIKKVTVDSAVSSAPCDVMATGLTPAVTLTFMSCHSQLKVFVPRQVIFISV